MGCPRSRDGLARYLFREDSSRGGWTTKCWRSVIEAPFLPFLAVTLKTLAMLFIIVLHILRLAGLAYSLAFPMWQETFGPGPVLDPEEAVPINNSTFGAFKRLFKRSCHFDDSKPNWCSADGAICCYNLAGDRGFCCGGASFAGCCGNGCCGIGSYCVYAET